METSDVLNINQKLDSLVIGKNLNNKFKSKCQEIKLVKVFNYLIGKQEPFIRQVQSNKLYRMMKVKRNCSIKDCLETVIKSNDEFLIAPKIVAKEIIEDQEKINKLKFILF